VEQRYALGLAYQAGPDEKIHKGLDGRRDFISAPELEKAAWRFIKSRESGLLHVDGTEGHIDVVESYIYRGPDWQVSENTVIKSGDWLVGAVFDEPTWELVKEGKLKGWSPQGRAKLHAPKE
jgi:hypothetical protein